MFENALKGRLKVLVQFIVAMQMSSLLIHFVQFAVELHRISLFRKEALSTRLRSEFLGDRKMKMYLIQEFLGNNSQKGLSNITSNGSIPLGVSYHSDSSEIHPNTNSQPVTSPLYSGINFRLAPSLIPATGNNLAISLFVVFFFFFCCR